MSDVKQQILDELDDKFQTIAKEPFYDKDDHTQGIQFGVKAGISAAMAVINKHLEGYVILPEEPTEEMVKNAKSPLNAFAGIHTQYKVMLDTFRTQS